MAGHRSLEPAVVVRIHPGQLMPLRPHAQRLLSPWALMALGLFAFSLPLQLNSQVVVPDSSQLHERARKAQRDFEFFHRDHLPHTAYLPQGRCDEYVGRLCLTGNDLTWNPSPEASTIVEAREVLLAELAEVNETLPGEHWVRGPDY